MKFLVIGLGSMGKRRVRNLIALGHGENTAGFDVRQDRIEEATKYNIRTYSDFERAMAEFKPDAFIISTPPNLHMHYAYIAANAGISCFIEASVVDSEKILKLAEILKGKKIFMAPSCTMCFYPGPRTIKRLIQDGMIGKVLNYNYVTGQYLPDWHPWEKIEDYYVSNPDTGGCREIVPFELTWLVDIFGKVKPLGCLCRKLTDMPAKIDDIYHCFLEHEEGILGNLTVEVISRPRATRNIRILGEKGEIDYCGDDNSVKFINTEMTDWEYIKFDKGTVEKNYINPEEPYINEIESFINAISEVKSGKEISFPNCLEKDYEVLKILYELESLSEGKNELSR